MTDIPMKMYWKGRDIAELPRSELIEIIAELNRQIESNREAVRSITEIHNLARAARRS